MPWAGFWRPVGPQKPASWARKNNAFIRLDDGLTGSPSRLQSLPRHDDRDLPSMVPLQGLTGRKPVRRLYL